jgi:hypothetical protein
MAAFIGFLLLDRVGAQSMRDFGRIRTHPGIEADHEARLFSPRGALRR